MNYSNNSDEVTGEWLDKLIFKDSGKVKASFKFEYRGNMFKCILRKDPNSMTVIGIGLTGSDEYQSNCFEKASKYLEEEGFADNLFDTTS